MTYSVFAVANTLLDLVRGMPLSDRSITPVKLQRLLFFAQSWHQRQEDYPLFDDFFARWPTGPVVPAVFHKLKAVKGEVNHPLCIGATPDGGYVIPAIPNADAQAMSFLKDLLAAYGGLSAGQLSWLATEPDGAWAMQLPDGSVIENHEMAARIKVSN